MEIKQKKILLKKRRNTAIQIVGFIEIFSNSAPKSRCNERHVVLSDNGFWKRMVQLKLTLSCFYYYDFNRSKTFIYIS